MVMLTQRRNDLKMGLLEAIGIYEEEISEEGRNINQERIEDISKLRRILNKDISIHLLLKLVKTHLDENLKIKPLPWYFIFTKPKCSRLKDLLDCVIEGESLMTYIQLLEESKMGREDANKLVMESHHNEIERITKLHDQKYEIVELKHNERIEDMQREIKILRSEMESLKEVMELRSTESWQKDIKRIDVAKVILPYQQEVLRLTDDISAVEEENERLHKALGIMKQPENCDATSGMIPTRS